MPPPRESGHTVWAVLTKLLDPFRCEGDLSRSDSHCVETGDQSGDPILRDEFAKKLVQR